MNKRILFTIVTLLMLTLQAMAQTVKISGTVTSKSDGEPLIGATVKEVGTQQAAVTDFDGNFTIQVKKGAQLQFSYVGFDTQTLAAANGMKVELSDAAELQELVVTGYQVQRKADLTGAVGVVETKDFKPSTPDPMSSLQGKVAGMTITTSGSPSGDADVKIRGISNMGNSATAPLYIVDGMPFSGSLSSLNSSDIESMQVLKDAASASIYGSRASNGVVIITTKKGKKGEKVNVDFNASVTVAWMSQKMNLMNSQQYATAAAQAALNDGLDAEAYCNNYGLTLKADGGTPITVYNPETKQMENYAVGGMYNGYINEKKSMLYSDTDWQDVISRTGVTQNYDLSLSKATDKGSALFSFGYKKATGVLKYTDFENFSGRINSSYKINHVISVGENANISYSNNVDCAPLENALKMSPIIPVYEVDGETFAGPVKSMSDRQNPLRELYHNKDNRLKKWNIFANAYVDITPIKGLLLRSNFGLDFTGSYIRSMTHTFSSDRVANATSSSAMSQTNSTKWTWTNTAQYNFQIKKVHDFNILAGIEVHNDDNVNLSARRDNLEQETIQYMWPDAATGIQYANGTGNAYRLMSYFGKVDYNWDDRLLASFTIRHDGSSRFMGDNQYGTFPSGSLGYRVSKHIKADWLRDWKVRVSYGVTGNQNINSNTAAYRLYTADYGNDRTTSTAYDLNVQGSGTFPSGYRRTQFGDANLKWETTSQWNIGTDFSLFDNELYGTWDIFFKETKDMLIKPAYLAAYGEGDGSGAWCNGPTMKNWGMEFNLGYRHKTAYGLSYNVSGNLDFYRCKVTYMPESVKNAVGEHTKEHNLADEGKAYGARLGYVVDGLYQSQAEVDKYNQGDARVGGPKYVDLNGDGKIDSKDKTWVYNPVPDFSYGLNVDLAYKNWDLNMFWQGVAGVDVVNVQKYQTDFWALNDPGQNKGDRVLEAWSTINTASSIPALTTTAHNEGAEFNSYFVENGSYVKLRTLQLGYTLSGNLLKKLMISKARLYLSGNNLWTIKSGSLTCTDPENPSFAYPHTASFTFGMQVSF